MFWLLASLLVLLTILVLTRVLMRAEPVQNGDNKELDIYRQQLRDLDGDLARGVVSQEDADSARLEISRRLLAADKAQAKAVRNAPKQPIILIAASVAVLAPAFYLQLGTPGYQDLPYQQRIERAQERYENRPDQATAEASLPQRPQSVDPEHEALVVQLREVLETRPNDLTGLGLLATNEARLSNFTAAYAAQEQLIRVKGDAVTANDYALLADMMVLSAQGYVSPEAEQALTRALTLDPTHGTARYYIGLMNAQNGRPDQAFYLWRSLLNEGPEDAAWMPAIRAEIGDAARLAGIRFDLPEAPGPSADDIAAAAELSAEDRAAMVEGMVARLSDRLQTSGGTVSEWARLIEMQLIIGAPDQARQTLATAQDQFANDPSAQEILTRAGEAIDDF